MHEDPSGIRNYKSIFQTDQREFRSARQRSFWLPGGAKPVQEFWYFCDPKVHINKISYLLLLFLLYRQKKQKLPGRSKNTMVEPAALRCSLRGELAARLSSTRQEVPQLLSQFSHKPRTRGAIVDYLLLRTNADFILHLVCGRRPRWF